MENKYHNKELKRKASRQVLAWGGGGRNLKTQFPDALQLHELCCNDQTKLFCHSQNAFQTLFVTKTLNDRFKCKRLGLEHCTLVY